MPIGYNKYSYLNDVCADHDYDSESTVPRAQIHNMVPIKRRFLLKAGYQSVFGQNLYGVFLDPGGSMVGSIDDLDGFYKLNHHSHDIRILSLIERTTNTGQPHAVSLYINGLRGLATFHRVEIQMMRDTGSGGDPMNSPYQSTSTVQTYRRSLDIASDTDPNINSAHATEVYNNVNSNMQELKFSPQQSTTHGLTEPWFFAKPHDNTSVWWNVAYEITVYHYPITVARFEVDSIVGSSNPITLYNSQRGTGFYDGRNCKERYSDPDPELAHGSSVPGIAWFDSQEQLHLTIDKWSFGFEQLCWEYCKVNSMIFRRRDAVETTLATNSDGTRKVRWVWYDVKFGPFGQSSSSVVNPTVVQLIQGDLIEYQKQTSLRFVDGITQPEFYSFYDRDEHASTTSNEIAYGPGSFDSEIIGTPGSKALMPQRHVNWSRSHQRNTAYFDSNNPSTARNFTALYYNNDRRELVIKMKFLASDHLNTRNDHEKLWDVLQMGPVCVHRNSFEVEKVEPVYTSSQQVTGYYSHHECTWRKHFPAQREISSGSTNGSITESGFAEQCPRGAFYQRALKPGGTIALRPGNTASAQLNEYAGGVYNFWAYEDRCIITAPLEAASDAGLLSNATTHSRTWNSSNKLVNGDVLLIDTDFTPGAVYDVSGPLLGATLTAEGAVAFYSTSSNSGQNWTIKVAKDWAYQGYEKILDLSGTGGGVADKRNRLLAIRTSMNRSYHIPKIWTGSWSPSTFGSGNTGLHDYLISGYDYHYDQEFTDPGVDHVGGITRYVKEGIDYDIMYPCSPMSEQLRDKFDTYDPGGVDYENYRSYEASGHGACPFFGTAFQHFSSSNTSSNNPAFTEVTSRSTDDYEATKAYTIKMETPAGGVAAWNEATITQTFSCRAGQTYYLMQSYDKKVRFISNPRLGNPNNIYGLEVFNAAGSKRFDVSKRTARIHATFSGNSTSRITSATIPELNNDETWGVIQTYPSSIFNALIKPGPAPNGDPGPYIDIFTVSGQQTGGSFNNFWTVYNWEIIVFRI
jgi:hypothetical protein